MLTIFGHLRLALQATNANLSMLNKYFVALTPEVLNHKINLPKIAESLPMSFLW